MDGIPETLQGTIDLIRKELAVFVSQDRQDDEDCKQVQRVLGWFEDLRDLRIVDAVAIENAINAIRRIADSVEFGEKTQPGDRHYINRLNKLISNLQEVVELEAKKNT